VTTSEEHVNSVAPKAVLSDLRAMHVEIVRARALAHRVLQAEISANAHLVPDRAMRVLRAENSLTHVETRHLAKHSIANRASVRANRPSASIAKTRSNLVLRAEIARHAKADSADPTHGVAVRPVEVVVHAAALAPADAAADRAATRRVIRALAVEALAREVQGQAESVLEAHAEAARGRVQDFVAISFSDTLILGTNL
jgi:hypothetical protein